MFVDKNHINIQRAAAEDGVKNNEVNRQRAAVKVTDM